MTPPDRI